MSSHLSILFRMRQSGFGARFLMWQDLKRKGHGLVCCVLSTRCIYSLKKVQMGLDAELVGNLDMMSAWEKIHSFLTVIIIKVKLFTFSFSFLNSPLFFSGRQIHFLCQTQSQNVSRSFNFLI